MHECAFSRRDTTSEWSPDGAYLTRYITSVPTCRDCGKVQPTIQGIRPHKFRDRRAATPTMLRTDSLGPLLASALLANRRPGWIPWPGLSTQLLAKHNDPGQWLETIENIVDAGWIMARYRRDSNGTYTLHALQILQRQSLEECHAPGLRQARLEARDESLAATGTGAYSQQVRRFLEGDAWASWPPEAIRLLAVVARHAETGHRLATRVVSGLEAEDTKLLERHQARLESILGPYEDLGLRGHSSLTLLGGQGQIELPQGRLDIGILQPYGAITVQQLQGADLIRLGHGGACFIENKTVFEAACFGELDLPPDTLFIWTGGQPNRGVQHVASLIRQTSAPITFWCDLDPAGIDIARRLRHLTQRGDCLHMSVADYRAAPVRRPIEGANLRLLDSLAPTGFLDALVAAMKEDRVWVEHETQLLVAAKTVGHQPIQA